MKIKKATPNMLRKKTYTRNKPSSNVTLVKPKIRKVLKPARKGTISEDVISDAVRKVKDENSNIR